MPSFDKCGYNYAQFSNSKLYLKNIKEIKEERKSGKIIWEIRIDPKRYYCAVAALNIGVPPLFKIGRIC